MNPNLLDGYWRLAFVTVDAPEGWLDLEELNLVFRQARLGGVGAGAVLCSGWLAEEAGDEVSFTLTAEGADPTRTLRLRGRFRCRFRGADGSIEGEVRMEGRILRVSGYRATPL